MPVAYTLFAAQTVVSRILLGDRPGEPPGPRLFHATSVLLHVANSLLAWSLLVRLTAGHARTAATKWLARAVLARPGHVNANVSLGLALDKLGRLEEAASCDEAVLALRPSHAEALNYLGVIRARQGHVTEPADYFRRAVAAKPASHDARHSLQRAERLLNAGPR